MMNKIKRPVHIGIAEIDPFGGCQIACPAYTGLGLNAARIEIALKKYWAADERLQKLRRTPKLPVHVDVKAKQLLAELQKLMAE